MRSTQFGSGGPPAETLTLPQDAHGFVRRECAACHRVFKVRSGLLEGLLVFRRVARRVSHSNEHEAVRPLGQKTCPYCAARADDDAWFTAEQRAWADKRADTLGQELRYEQLAHVERTLAANPNPTFLAVRPQPPPSPPAAEPDDMRAVSLLCCVEELKVSEAWTGAVYCFYCGTQHEHGSKLIQQRLARLLE